MVAQVIERYWRPNRLDLSFPTETIAAKLTITNAISAYMAKVNRAMYLIPRCRTGRLGAMPMQCEQCGGLAMKLRSCQGRHCPTCNAQNRQQWRNRLVDWSLDCNYLHVVFTLPHELNELIYTNQKPMHKRGVVKCEDTDAMFLSLKKIAKKNWVINVQPPPPHCQGAEAVIHYLSSYVIGGPISDRRIVDDDGKFVTIRFKNYTTEQIEFEKILGTEFANRFSNHILPPYMQRVHYTSLFQPAGRVPRLKHAQALIIAGGFACRCNPQPPDSTTDGVERILLGVEYDEDEFVETSEPTHEKPTGPQGCAQCEGQMRTSRDEWLSSRATVSLLRVVKVLLLLIRCDGESILIQIQRLLLHHPIMTQRYHSAYEVDLLESMLLECVVDPRALWRRILGLNHPLIVAARDRAPPDEEQRPADA